MELRKIISNYLRFNETPFIQERTVCGINALIEVQDLPIQKLNDAINSSVIGYKLREISGGKSVLETIDGQSIQLQFIL